MASAACFLKMHILHACYRVPLDHSRYFECDNCACRITTALDVAWMAVFTTFGILGASETVSMPASTTTTLLHLAPVPLYLLAGAMVLGCCLSRRADVSETYPIYPDS